MSEQSTMMKDHITIEGRDGAFGAYYLSTEDLASSRRRRSPSTFKNVSV
jgi:hypothetical protein